MKLCNYTVTINNEVREILSIATPEVARIKGLVSKGIIGHLKDRNSRVLPDNIIYNPEFIDSFARSVKKAALASDGLVESAKQQSEGYIYIIDQRGNGDDAIDILASFELSAGQVKEDSFQFNPQYQIISARGIFQLPNDFEKVIIEDIYD